MTLMCNNSNKRILVLSVGGLINEYLQSSVQTDDRAIHLLFSANRWEAAPNLVDTLARGTNIICDRYAYSGVAFTSAKTAEDRSSMSGGELTLDWCMSGDVGLPVSGSGSAFNRLLLASRISSDKEYVFSEFLSYVSSGPGCSHLFGLEPR